MNGEEDIKKNKRLNGKRVLKAVRSLQKFLSKSSKPRGRPPKRFKKSNIGRGLDLEQIEEFWKRKWGEEGLDTIQSSLDEEVKNGKLVMYNGKYCLRLHNNDNPSPNNGNEDDDEEDEELLEKDLGQTIKKEENLMGDTFTNTSEDKDQLFSVSPKVETKLSNGKQEGECVPVVVVVRRDVENKKIDPSDKKKRKLGAESSKGINTVTLIKKFKLENKDDVKLIITSDKNSKSTNKTDNIYNLSDSIDKTSKKCESCSGTDQNEQLLTCKFCHICYHPSCLGYSRELSLKALSQAWECANCKTCVVCRGSEEEKMLICDSCDRGYHMQCHQPPINHSFDNEDWICSSCKGKKGSIIKRNISIIVPNNNNTATHANNVATTNHNNVSTHNITTHADNTPTQTALEGKKLNEEDDGQSNELGSTGGHTALPRVLFTTDADVGGASDWSVQQVHEYFVKAGYSEQADTFVKEEIDGKALLLLLRQDIVAGMNFKLGPALKINAHVDRIKKANNQNDPDVISGQ